MLPKLIIFDWDDTLANTREAVVNAMNYVLSLYNLQSLIHVCLLCKYKVWSY